MQENTKTEAVHSITLLVTGSIAAYKSAELVRGLTKSGFAVRVAMTASATEFISPLTLQTLSGELVSTELFDLNSESEIGHISLADEADLVLVAPATGNFIAKAALGLANDLASTVLLAATCPVIFAPALNVNMWKHAATQANVALLRERGCDFVEPEEGELACGWQGAGRLAETELIVNKVRETLLGSIPKKKARKTATTFSTSVEVAPEVIVLAGATREAIDPIRFVTNLSSGKMGYALAEAAAQLGASVRLISGPTNLATPYGVERHDIDSALSMQARLMELVEEFKRERRQRPLVVFFAAAVADHRPAKVFSEKMKRSKKEGFSLEFVPNPDIIAEFSETAKKLRAKGTQVICVGFAAETEPNEEALLQLAKEKMLRKKADMLVANNAAVMGSDSSRICILDREIEEEQCVFREGTKKELASLVVQHALKKIIEA